MKNESKLEKRIKTYEDLGIRKFQSATKKIVGAVFKKLPNYRLEKISKNGLKEYRNKIYLNELIHAPQIVFAGYELAKSISENNFLKASICYGAMIINGYCVISQEYNRARINRILGN